MMVLQSKEGLLISCLSLSLIIVAGDREEKHFSVQQLICKGRTLTVVKMLIDVTGGVKTRWCCQVGVGAPSLVPCFI